METNVLLEGREQFGGTTQMKVYIEMGLIKHGVGILNGSMCLRIGSIAVY
jgi:hypothetical protein